MLRMRNEYSVKFSELSSASTSALRKSPEECGSHIQRPLTKNKGIIVRGYAPGRKANSSIKVRFARFVEPCGAIQKYSIIY
jgi:hypothetical protein